MSAQALGSSRKSRLFRIKRILWVVFFLNVGVALAKYACGVAVQSVSMQADGIHSLFDGAGNLVGLVGISLASRPADTNHPYGHAKFETYASLVIGIFLLLAAFEVSSQAIRSLMDGAHSAEVNPLSFVVMIVTLVVNISVSRFEHVTSKHLSSAVLRADAAHTLSDALVSLGVIVGLVLVALGFPLADPIMALIVSLAILLTAKDVFAQGLATLSDRARIPEEELAELVSSLNGVSNPHHIRTRGTESEVYVDLHVLVDPEMSVLAAHRLADTIEDMIAQKYPQVFDVLVHIEPDGEGQDNSSQE